MRLPILLLAVCAFGGTFQIEPVALPQGGVIHVKGDAEAVSARMLDRTIRLFPQAGDERLGLIPVAANQTPGKFRLEILASNGAVLRTTEITVVDAHFPEQNVKLAPQIEALQPAPGEIDTVAAFRKAVSDVRYWQEPFASPIKGCMMSPYGVSRLHNGKPTGSYHGGIDQRSPAGQPIHSIADGTVRLVREFNVNGHVVGVDHGQGLSSMYLHMSKFAVAEGARVKKGDILGYVGSTGRSTAPHLHWSIYANGVSVNPAQWIAMRPCDTSQPKAKSMKRRRK